MFFSLVGCTVVLVHCVRPPESAGWHAHCLAVGSLAERHAILRPLGPVAQLVEQRIENPRVGGSIPPQATNLKAQLFSVGLFLCPQPRIYGALQPFYVCFGSSRVSINLAVRHIEPEATATANAVGHG